MVCGRCKNECDVQYQEREVLAYGHSVEIICPHCGKLYIAERIVRIVPIEDECIDGMWTGKNGNKIVKDSEYFGSDINVGSK